MNRIVVIFLLIFLGMALLLYRAFYLQIIRHSDFVAQVEDLFKTSTTIPAPRGEILDRNGIKLAWNQRSTLLKIVGNLDKERLKNVLMPYFSDRTQEIIELLKAEGSVNIKLPESLELQLYSVKGLEVVPVYSRTYKGEAFSHVLGYANLAGEGLSGLEKFYDSILKGKPGELLRSSKGEVIDKIPPIPGKNLRTSIDARLQEYAYQLLEETRKPGAAILMNPNTGEIYSLVSYPGYDPNLLSRGLDEAQWRLMAADPRGKFINRAISATYSPGSAIKPLILITGLYYQPQQTETMSVNCKGHYNLYDSSGNLIASYSDWYPLGHGVTDYIKGIAVSCNVFFFELGRQVGIEKMREMASMLQIDGLTGIDLPWEKRGTFPDPRWKYNNVGEQWYLGDTILTSIGQGYVRLTPIELLQLYNLIATRGKVVKPHIVMSGDSERMRIDIGGVFDKLVEALTQVTTKSGASLADRGTAYSVFKNFPATVAGKTGTAEVGGGRAPHSWFAGFVPADRPAVSVVVFVENGGYGSQTAAPIAEKLLSKFFELYPDAVIE